MLLNRFYPYSQVSMPRHATSSTTTRTSRRSGSYAKPKRSAWKTLNVHGMSRIHGRSVLTVAPSRFVMKLEHKAQQYGRQIRHIGRFQPSTRLCSQCGHHEKGGVPENIRVWKCAECHTILDRDYNAALNILDAAGLAESLNARGDSVRLHLATAGRSNSQRNANHRHHTDAGIPML